ncbi:hypothetical protein GCM10022239_14410 [Leifsonia bigeumensis]|uniref:Metallo-beta-lactamase domain-containing protein n=1 Tax=Leifsonella bigeumensis TaxID=433643 RepID=A0ABP7FJ07_9MICO
MYEATPIVNGFPGKTETHGSFGWSSVWLLRGFDRVIIVETGPPSYLPLITTALSELGLGTNEVTDVLITHAHWDHLGNISLFPQARRWIGRVEYEWALSQAPDEPFVSQPLLGALSHPQGLLRLIDGESELVAGVRAHNVPGHTPGHLAFAVDTTEGPKLFTGDAAKNIHELESVAVDSAVDRGLGARSVTWIREFARNTGSSVVPGHDVECELTGHGWQRRSEQRAEIQFFHRRDAPPARISLSDAELGPVAVEPFPPECGMPRPSINEQANAE